MAAKLGIGVVGVGTIGRRHAENIAGRIPHAKLLAVADTNIATAQAVADDLGADHFYDSAEALAANPAVDAVLIASVASAHLEGIVAAARHGKAILCEKPITASLADADRALATVAAAHVPLDIGFTRRFDAGFVEAKARIDAGEIGTPVLVKATHRNAALPPSLNPAVAGPLPGGVFIDAAIHDFDQARWFLNDEVVEVHAVTATVSEPSRTDDLAMATLRFSRGGLAAVEIYLTCGYGYDVRCEIGGTHGTLFVGDVRASDCQVATMDGLSRHLVAHWLDRFAAAYLLEVELWVERTLAGQLPVVTGADGRAALAIAEAAIQSAHEGQSIHLPPMPDGSS